jgi:RNA polymerase sigma-70 factor (ECF subfamily)
LSHSEHPGHADQQPEVLLVQRLFVQEISALRGMLWTLVPDRHRLDDVVQETFLTVTRKAADFQEGTNFRAWLFAIARFKVLHSLRQSPCAHALDTDVIDLLAAEVPDIDNFEEQLSHLNHCVERLGDQPRKMLHLRYEDGLSIAEVADRLGRRVESVKVMLSRVRSSLRECIEKQQLQNPAHE